MLRRWTASAVALALAYMVAAAGPADAYTQPSSLSDGHDYSNVCPPRPADSTSSDDQVVALVVIEQELADQCVRDEQTVRTTGISQAHSDAQAIDNDVQAAKTATDGVKTADDNAASEAHTDAGTAHTDAVAIANGEPSAPAGAQTVDLSMGDRTELADAESALHGDVWVLIGVTVGCFAGSVVLQRVLT